jgi:hypothetical protein
MTDIVARVLSHPPMDTRYLFGRWHKDRATLRGIHTEARVWASGLLSASNHDVRKFLIISRARSGSTVLTRLLNSHPDVRCGRELLSKRVLFPVKFLHQLASKSPTRVYGAKILSYQMVQVQRFRDPVKFLTRLQAEGFQLIHIERDTFAQTLSLMMAQSNAVFHESDGTAGGKKSWVKRPMPDQSGPIHIDIEDFLRRLEWSQMLLAYEKHCLRALPHLAISYEKNLQGGDQQQATANRIFDLMALPPAPVFAGLKKILPQDSSTVIANYNALTAAMRARGFGDMVSQ